MCGQGLALPVLLVEGDVARVGADLRDEREDLLFQCSAGAGREEPDAVCERGYLGGGRRLEGEEGRAVEGGGVGARGGGLDLRWGAEGLDVSAEGGAGSGEGRAGKVGGEGVRASRGGPWREGGGGEGARK